MFQKATVFVVGAGANHELGLPVGETLMNEVRDALDFRHHDTGDADDGDLVSWGNVVARREV
jgi:hypothetical protein